MTPRSEPSKPQRAAIYCRISLDRSGARLGVKRQADESRELAERLGWQVHEVYDHDNDISAASGKRRADWERLLRDIESGAVDGLIAWHLDRLLRRLVDLERLLDALQASPHAVQVAFVQSGEIDLTTAPGRMLARILATVAANESEMKAERVRAARRQEAHAGRAHTLLGYGYNNDRTINPAERAIVVEVKDRLLAGESLLGIAKVLNSRAVPTPASGKWTSRHVTRTERLEETPETVKRLIGVLREERPIPAGEAARLLNAAQGRQGDGSRWRVAQVQDESTLWPLLATDLPRNDSQIARVLIAGGVPTERMYWRAANLRAMIRRGSLCGWREFSPGNRGGHGELIAEGNWTAILTKEETEAIRKITDKRAPVKGGRAPQHLLSGLVRCGRCNSKMGGHTDKKTGVLRYGCSQQTGVPDRCGKTAIVGAPVDAMVTRTVIDALADSNLRTSVRARARDPHSEHELREAEQTLERLRSDLTTYTQDAAAGRLTPSEFYEIRDGVHARIRETEKVLGEQSAPVKHALRDIPVRRRRVEEWWAAASLERKREVVSTLIGPVVIDPAQRRSNRFDPGRVRLPNWRA